MPPKIGTRPPKIGRIPLHPPYEILISELAYSLTIFSLCLIIYLKTKEVYELTANRGIRYFRNAFLFLGLAYLVRFLFRALALSGVVFDVGIYDFRAINELRILMISSGFLVAYFSSLSILYLALSLVWRRLKDETRYDALVHITAIALPFSWLALHSPVLLLGFQLILFAFLVISAFINYQSSEAKKPFISQIYIVYFLIFIFWILNLAITLRLLPELILPLYFASTAVMAYIAWRVLRKI